MRIKGDDIAHTHVDQFLQSDGTVEGFAGGTFVLATLIQHRHDHARPPRLAANRRDGPFQILKMFIGTHGNVLSVHAVGHTVVEAVRENVDIVTAHGFMQKSLAFAGAETRAVRLGDIGNIRIVTSPLTQVKIHLLHEFLTAAHSNHAQFAEKAVAHTFTPFSIYSFHKKHRSPRFRQKNAAKRRHNSTSNIIA